MFHRHRPTTTTTRSTKPTFMTRLKGRNARTQTVKTKTTTTRHEGPSAKGRKWGRPRTQQRRRKVTFGDKVSGAMLKLKGSLTHRPAVKAAGTRRMHGTDGLGGHRHRAY